jgi:hypothetical protein
MLQGHSKIENVATRTAEPRRVKTAQNSQRSKASNAVLVNYCRTVRGVKSFHSLEVCNLVTIAIVNPGMWNFVQRKVINTSVNFVNFDD